MKVNSRTAIGAIVLAAAVAVATPLTAQAARGGGGGGHFGGGGGGHFGGGGGGHFGGGGGGHFGGGGGHFGGGGMRLGGMPHLGGGGLRGGRFGGLRIGGGGLHLGALSSGRMSRGAFHFGGHELQTGRSSANIHGLSRGRGMLATRVAPGFSKRAFAREAFVHNGFQHFRRFGVFGWAGPVFWPYAYNDINCGIFWGYWGSGCADPYWSLAYGNPFWDYGYADIYGGLFSPFGFDDLAAYAPSGSGRGRRTQSTVSVASGQIAAQMCGDDTREVADWPIDRIQQLVSPDDQQHVALDDLSDASMKAAQIIKTACPTSAVFTPTGRLAAMQQRIEAMEQAVDVVRGPLDRFYGSLTDEQKAKLNSSNQAQAQPNARPRGLAQSCNRNATTDWPEARIEAAVRPNEEQQAKLKALQSAATQAADELAAACPSEMPTTPPARLAAVSKRLDVMLGTVKHVRGALDDFYADLSDEQKAQFNRIGQSRSAER
jgi:LTXXQ motif family protein